MICRTCLLRASVLRPNVIPIRRTFSIAAPRRNAAAPAGTEASPDVPPLTDPLNTPPSGEAGQAALSSCPKGTVLTGLNYFKGKEDPVAQADQDYPEWLWKCLEVTVKQTEETAKTDGGDEFSKSKKQRRLAAKKQRLLEAKLLAAGDLEALAPKIPLQQQSINLPGGEDEGVEGAVFAAEKREDLRRAMRKERRAKIKESNFLKSM